MLYDLRIPKVSPFMTGALIETIYGQCDTLLPAGAKMLDMSVDLGSAFAQDCPPITYYRLVLRETLWLRTLAVTVGASWNIDQPVAIFSMLPDEPLNGPVERLVRSAVAGIIYHSGMWSGNAH